MKQLATLPSALQSEKSTEFVKGLERTWVRHFGLPKYLRVDAARGWESKAVRDWCSDQGVILEVAPPQSHSLELSSDDIKSFAELWNSTWMTKGVTLSPCSKMQPSTFRQSSTGCLLQQAFTPNQWVLGKTPQQDLSLMSELYNPGVDNIDEATHFANIQQKRLQAGIAFLKADSDAKLRRAMGHEPEVLRG